MLKKILLISSLTLIQTLPAHALPAKAWLKTGA